MNESQSQKLLHRLMLAALLVAVSLGLLAGKIMIDNLRRDAITSSNLGRVSQILLATDYALQKKDRCLFDPSEGHRWKKEVSKFTSWDAQAAGQPEIAPIFFLENNVYDHSDIVAVCARADTGHPECCDEDFFILCSDIPELQFAPDSPAVLSVDDFISLCKGSCDKRIMKRQLILGKRSQVPYVSTVGEFITKLRPKKQGR